MKQNKRNQLHTTYLKTSDYQEFLSQTIHDARISSGLSLEALGKMVNSNRTTLSKIEKGLYPLLDIDLITNLSFYLQIDLSLLAFLSFHASPAIDKHIKRNLSKTADISFILDNSSISETDSIIDISYFLNQTSTEDIPAHIRAYIYGMLVENNTLCNENILLKHKLKQIYKILD